ncbi:MAG: hypothetical protein U0X39_11930 [Bacteroidales bacterium]
MGLVEENIKPENIDKNRLEQELIFYLRKIRYQRGKVKKEKAL